MCVYFVSLCGIYEYNKCFKAKEIHPIPLVGYMSCFIIPLLGTTLDLNIKLAIGAIWIILSLIYMFTYISIKMPIMYKALLQISSFCRI